MRRHPTCVRSGCQAQKTRVRPDRPRCGAAALHEPHSGPSAHSRRRSRAVPPHRRARAARWREAQRHRRRLIGNDRARQVARDLRGVRGLFLRRQFPELGQVLGLPSQALRLLGTAPRLRSRLLGAAQRVSLALRLLLERSGSLAFFPRLDDRSRLAGIDALGFVAGLRAALGAADDGRLELDRRTRWCRA